MKVIFDSFIFCFYFDLHEVHFVMVVNLIT